MKAGGRAFAPDAGPGGGISSAIALHTNRRPPSRTDSPAPGRGNGRRARAYLHFSPVYPGLSRPIPVYPGLFRSIPVYPGLFRSIPVYPGLSRFIPVDSGLSWSVPVYSGPSRPVPVAAGMNRMRSAERRVKGAARTAAPCRERRRVRRSPTPFGPRTVDGVHAPVDSIRSPPGQPRSSRAPGRPHLEISGRRADVAIAGRGRARPPSALLPRSRWKGAGRSQGRQGGRRADGARGEERKRRPRSAQRWRRRRVAAKFPDSSAPV